MKAGQNTVIMCIYIPRSSPLTFHSYIPNILSSPPEIPISNFSTTNGSTSIPPPQFYPDSIIDGKAARRYRCRWLGSTLLWMSYAINIISGTSSYRRFILVAKSLSGDDVDELKSFSPLQSTSTTTISHFLFCDNFGLTLCSMLSSPLHDSTSV